MNRRGFLLGLSAAIVAPAIVKAEGLMKINKLLVPSGDGVALYNTAHPMPDWLPCNGALLDSAFYPELFKHLGHKYGGFGEDFRVPVLPGACIKTKLDQGILWTRWQTNYGLIAMMEVGNGSRSE